MTTIHTRHLQQYIQDNYNNTHKITNNNTQDNSQKYTQDILKYNMYKSKQHHGKKVLYTVSSIFPHTYSNHTFTPALHFSPLYYSYKLFP